MKIYDIVSLYDNGVFVVRSRLNKVKDILYNDYNLSPSQIKRIIDARNKKDINGLYLTNSLNYDNGTISTQKTRHNRQKRREYDEIIYALDIETSTYTSNDGRNISLMYLGCIKGVWCLPDEINTGNYKDYIVYNKFFRSYEELNNILVELNEIAKKDNIYTYIYIHNLSYEFSFFQNLDFFKKSYNNETMIATNGRKPISFELEHLIIRCSYKLIGKSLSAIGDLLNFNKLTDLKTYDVKFTPKSKLPNNEYIYNERDVDVTLLGVLNTFKNSNYYTDVSSIQKMITATSLTRLENQLLTENKKIKEYTASCTSLIQFYNATLPTGRIVYKMLRESFVGGYVRGNRHFLFQPIKNVHSFDISSSYPAQMFMSYYPYDFKVVKDHLLQRLLFYEQENTKYIKNVVKWYLHKPKKTLPHYYICKIKLTNLQCKEFRNNNEMPLISISKCENVKKSIVSNGRVLKADELTICCTVFDVIMYEMFYNFNISDCYELLHTSNSAKLHDYVTNSLHYFSKQKTVLKSILNGNYEDATKNDFKYNDDYIVSDEFIDLFLSTENKKSKKYLLKTELSLAKNRLNGQYGINVQQLAPDIIEYCVDNNSWEHTEKSNIDDFKLMRNYIVGVHITAYARLHLSIMTYLLFNQSDCTVLYWDTDSIKLFNDDENVKKCFEYFNNSIKKYWNNEKFYNMGLYDYEGMYNHFVTGGAKSYIYEKNNEITVSISGVPKRTTSEYLNTLYDGDFTEFIKKYYHPNVTFCSDITKKLASSYYKGQDNYFINETLVDDNNEKYIFNGFSGCILIPNDFTITGAGWVDTNMIEECQNLNRLIKKGISVRYTPIGTPSKIDDRLEIYTEG